MIAPAIFKQDLSLLDLLLMLVLLLLFRRPPVRIDAVENVASVVVDGSECSHDAETLILGLADTRRARVECVIHQIHARLCAPQQTALRKSVSTIKQSSKMVVFIIDVELS